MRTQPPINVTDAGWTRILTVGECRTLVVRQTNFGTTSDYFVASPDVTDGPATMPAGTAFPFTHAGPNTTFPGGVSLGWLRLAPGGGSLMFDIVET